MNKRNVFEFLDYLTFLKAKIASEKDSWGLITKLAAAANCQRPYLSKVLGGGAHLTPAQAYGIARFWKLSTDETEYFIGLLEMERSSSNEYKNFLTRKNHTLKKAHENLSNLVERKTAQANEKDQLYYSSWYWSAIHILVSIPAFQSVSAISERLSISEHQVKQTLSVLEQYGFVRQEKGKWKFAAMEQHIPKDSPLSVFHHSNWRQRAMLDAQEPNRDSIHFTVTQSLSQKDFERVKETILACIQEVEEIAGPSKEEELVCFTCDYFKV